MYPRQNGVAWPDYKRVSCSLIITETIDLGQKLGEEGSIAIDLTTEPPTKVAPLLGQAPC